VSEADFDRVRREPDPLVRARAATELLAVYQQRGVELARLRRVAVDQAAERGMPLKAIAAQIGVSKGRISQIRQSGPPAERVLFGIGPVTVAIPTRQITGRDLPMISSEDAAAADRVTAHLVELGFLVEQYRIPADGRWTPTGDVIAVCGPKSSPVIAEALTADPYLRFVADDRGRFGITDQVTGTRYLSAMDDVDPAPRDVAYVGRLPYDGGTMLVVAGVHAIGSLGAVDHLCTHAAEIYRVVGDGLWSGVIASTNDAGAVTGSEVVCPVRRH